MYIMHAWDGIEAWDRAYYLHVVRGWREWKWTKRVQPFKCVVCTQPTNDFIANLNSRQIMAICKPCWAAKGYKPGSKLVG